MKVGFTQVQERIGLALLPVLDKFTSFMIDKVFPAFEKYVAPAVQRLVDLFSSNSGGLGESFNNIISVVKSYVMPIFRGAVDIFNDVKSAITNNIDSFKEFFDVVKYFAPIIGKVIGGALSVVGDIAKIVITVIAQVMGAIKPMLNTAIDGINLVIRGLNIINPFKDIPYIPKIGASPTISTSGITSSSEIMNMQKAAGLATSGVSKAVAGGSATSNIAALSTAANSAVAATTPKFKTPTGLPALSPSDLNYKDNFLTSPMNTINVTVNGALDAESTARQIVTILNDSQARGTLGASGLVGAVSF